jgi:anti-anti-sigma regulatory factor
VIFSIFGRKEIPPKRRSGETLVKPARPQDGSATAPGAASDTGARALDQREIARRTAEKIDLIESQMDLAMAARPATPPAEAKPARGLASESTASWVLGESDLSPGEARHFGLLPVFQEAAILYSNGQSDEAAMILWDAIKEDSLGEHARQAWTMLFELYQASERQPEFESLAIVYASRFESSPPTWSEDLAPSTAKAAPAVVPSTIVFPSSLGAGAAKQVEQMQRAAVRGRAAAVDFSRVASVDAVGAGLLLGALADFRSRAGELTLSGVDELATAVSACIESGRRDPSDACWLLKLETLRFQGLQPQFEDLAIEYCLTYEVSPPSWEPLPPSMRLDGSASPGKDVPSEAAPDRDGAFVLEGEIVGRPAATFDALRVHAASRTEVVIDCRRLRRMDFAGAGELLNEVSMLRSVGKSMAFKDLSCLVGCLMMVMGIHELAEMNLRTR